VLASDDGGLEEVRGALLVGLPLGGQSVHPLQEALVRPRRLVVDDRARRLVALDPEGVRRAARDLEASRRLDQVLPAAHCEAHASD
jgi:hypothetical protein